MKKASLKVSVILIRRRRRMINNIFEKCVFMAALCIEISTFCISAEK